MNELIESWRTCALTTLPYVLSGDGVQGAQYASYQAFADSKDFGINSAEFQLGLIPQPYIGNLAEAKVFLFLLNPGFSPGDYYAQEHSQLFRQARKANLHQQSMSVDYPFFYLDPAFAWTAGGQWWQNKLRSVIEELAKHEKLVSYSDSFRAALQHTSKHIACLEFCPYFSKTYSSTKRLLHSSKLLLAYVQHELEQRCQSEKASVIILRQADKWGLPKSNRIIEVEKKQARGAHLTMNTAAGQVLYKELASLLLEA
ncbi:hypothetical protein [Hymenobacter psoromatis]|uniref:hypothetical protein n=1 Tax=Hymenobacter psoromatis TaxID=1484116 RepID=UPI001CBEC6B2|nr:hypothetical protein [Hymenobacter psoromatis]